MAQGQHIGSLVPLLVQRSVSQHDAVLHQGLGADQLIVGGIVDDIDDVCLVNTTLGASEVVHIQPQDLVLLIASSHIHSLNVVGGMLSVGSWLTIV